MSGELSTDQRVAMLEQDVLELKRIVYGNLQAGQGAKPETTNTRPILSQRDQRWASYLLGTSGVTIGGYGCAITCLAMWLNAVHPDTAPLQDPLTVDAMLKVSGGYASGNLLNWQKLPFIYDEIKYTGRVDCPNTSAPLNEIDDLLSRGVPVIVYVDFSTAPNLQQHFVIITGKNSDGYEMRDPWTGDAASITRYGKTPELAICGIIRLEYAK